jgi:predicted tellurium resistance membrane protein TerC
MAVVFISPKQRQRVFFMGITIMFLLFLLVISLGVFLSKPKEVSPVLVFNKPKVNIDMSIFDSDQFKGLQLFTEMKTQYSYKALTKNNKTETGFISAASIDEAKTLLENMGLRVSEVKEIEIGRNNPFAPYYQRIITPVISKAVTTTKK